MSTSFSFFAVTLKACGNALALYLEPLLLFRPLHRFPKSSLRDQKLLHQIDTLIGNDMLFVGNVNCEEKGIRIDGHWIGNVTCERGTVVISSSAVLEGELRAAFAVLNGTIKGSVVASSAVEIQPRAQIEGNVYAPVVEMHSGAMVRGQIVTSETPGSEKFIALRGTVREIADEAPKVRLIK